MSFMLHSLSKYSIVYDVYIVLLIRIIKIKNRLIAYVTLRAYKNEQGKPIELIIFINTSHLLIVFMNTVQSIFYLTKFPL